MDLEHDGQESVLIFTYNCTIDASKIDTDKRITHLLKSFGVSQINISKIVHNIQVQVSSYVTKGLGFFYIPPMIPDV